MALSTVSVGQKITAAIWNAVIAIVNRQGTTSIIPTCSTSGVAVGTNGTLTLTAAAGPDVRNIFSSSFDIYRMTYDLAMSAAAYPSAQFSVAGTASATGYSGTIGVNTAAAFTAAAAPTTTMQFATANAVAGGYQSGQIDFINPAKAAATRFDSRQFKSQTAATTWTIGNAAGGHSVATAYDGLLFTWVGGGTATGTIRFEGIYL